MPTPTFPSPDLDTVDRYLAGQLDPDRRAAFEAYCATHPTYGAAVDALRVAASRLELVPPMDRTAALAALQARIAHDVRVAAIAGKVRVAPRPRWGVAAIAAAAVIGVVAVTRFRAHGVSSPHTVVASYHTGYGQRANVTLADGSHVTLAPATTMRVERGDEADGMTRVVLDGEAFFRVAHQRRAPFVVVTGAVATRVLGTSFDVRRYATDRRVRVVVADGKVSVGATTPGAPSVTATAGVMAMVTDSTATTVARGDVLNYIAWSKGDLTFQHMRTSDVLETLGQWYGYEFKLRDSTLASHTLTFRFDGESEATVLRSLGVILDVTMTFNGRVVTLTPRSATGAPGTPARETIERQRTVPTQHMEVGR